MGDHAGYQWGIQERDAEWIWSVRSRSGDTVLVTGSAESRSHAAACVVRALICGVTMVSEPQSMAA